MKSNALPFLLALGLAQPALAGTDAPEQGAQSGYQAQPQSESSGGYGLSSGAPSGMRAEAGTDMEGAQVALDMPQPQTQGDVTYLCGGIGETEANYMNQQASDYDLKLTFASQRGAYLADVDVDIRSAQGESVLQVHCGAPILLVDLPRSGNYRIQADAAGFEQTRNVRVRAGRQTASNVVVTWPQRAIAQMEEQAPVTTGGEVETTGGAGGVESLR